MQLRSKLLSLATVLFLLSIVAPQVLAMPENPGRLQFRGASFPIEEEAGQVTIVVKRQNGSHGEVTVDYETSAGSATAGEDYEESSGTLTWGDGDRSDKSFTVTIFDDELDEGQETFGVQLSNPTGDATLGSVSVTTVRIKPSDREDDDGGDDDGGDDDGGDDDGDDSGTIKLTSITYPAYESSGVALVTVERADGSAGAVTVDFSTLDGSAVAGDDYTTTQTTLAWADGELGLQTVTIPVFDDDVAEDLETVTVVLTNATGGASLGVRDSATVLVIDDDGGAGACVPDEETLCLQDGRFEIVGTWTDFDGNSGPFHFVPATDGAGLAWFFTDDNVEFLIKVLNGCPVNGHFWVFYAATTNVAFSVTVTDLQTGDISVYENPLGSVPLATTDVNAFATCP